MTDPTTSPKHPSAERVGHRWSSDTCAHSPGPVVLTDAARIWCLEHDLDANHGGADHDDYDLVAEAAGSLEIPVPQPLLDYNVAFWFASHMERARHVGQTRPLGVVDTSY